MPIPAWVKGGRRTSVAGGTMIGITKTSPNIEANWEMIKYLYFSPELARLMYQKTSIIARYKRVVIVARATRRQKCCRAVDTAVTNGLSFVVNLKAEVDICKHTV